jgi:hypothetical protein
MIIRALGRTVTADPRPLVGFVLAVMISAITLASIVRGSISITTAGQESGPGGSMMSGLESVLQISVAAAAVSVFVCARALALSLGPEFRNLRAIGGATSNLHMFGLLVVAPTVGVGVALSTVASNSLAPRWSEPLAVLMDAGTGTAGPETAVLAAAALIIPASTGWMNGTRQRDADRRGRAVLRVALACGTAVFFVAPTILAVVFAPALARLVETSQGVEAAGKIATLESTGGGLAILSGAVFGIVGATVILAPLLARVLLAAAARCLPRGPIVPFVGLRLAQDRTAHLGALAGVVVAATGLVDAQALASAAASTTGHGGAGLHELALTLGPALIVAAACAVGTAFAQSRGTGTELRRLRGLGMTSFTRVGTLAIGAVSLGLLSVMLSATAVVCAWLVAVVAGLQIGTIHAADLLPPLVVSAGAMTLIIVVFVGSELIGGVIDDGR